MFYYKTYETVLILHYYTIQYNIKTYKAPYVTKKVIRRRWSYSYNYSCNTVSFV